MVKIINPIKQRRVCSLGFGTTFVAISLSISPLILQIYIKYYQFLHFKNIYFVKFLTKRKGIESNSIPSIKTMQPLAFYNCCLLSCNNFFVLPSLVLSKAKQPRIFGKAIVNHSFPIMAMICVELVGVEPTSKTKANNLIIAVQR